MLALFADPEPNVTVSATDAGSKNSVETQAGVAGGSSGPASVMSQMRNHLSQAVFSHVYPARLSTVLRGDSAGTVQTLPRRLVWTYRVLATAACCLVMVGFLSPFTGLFRISSNDVAVADFMRFRQPSRLVAPTAASCTTIVRSLVHAIQINAIEKNSLHSPSGRSFGY